MPAIMVKASESAWSGAHSMAQSQSAGLSRQRMIDARNDLMRSEREYISLSSESEASMQREAEAIERQAAKVYAEAWAIEQKTQTRATVLQAQARMETKLAQHITEIAERSALSILDRIKEASDSLMGYAGLIGKDLSDMMKKEAAEQVARKVKDIEAVEEALGDEARAIELLELTAQYKKDKAS